MADGERARGGSEAREPLRELAALYGVEVAHHDGFDREVHPGPETLLAVLRALGAPVEAVGDVPAALRERRREMARRLVEPVSVVWTGTPASLVLGAAAEPGAPVEVRVRTQDGTTLEGRAVAAEVGSVRIALPWTLETGYHELEVEAGGRRAEGLLVAAPRRAFGSEPGPGARSGRGREWGVFLPLYALRRGDGDAPGRAAVAGAGELSGLEELLRWTASRGGHAVGTLPLLATYLDGPLEPSPYAPVSRLFWNELYLDPTRLPEWNDAPEARSMAESRAFRDGARELDELSEVDYREAARLRHRILDVLARTWMERRGEAGHGFRGRVAEHPDLVPYADFRGAVARTGAPGEAWPERWRSEGIPAEARDEAARLRHLYAQLRFPDQLREVRDAGRDAGAGLYLDLPLGTHPDGFDPWMRPELFARDAALGAPPDAFQLEGQDWSLPPMKPEASRREGHGHLRSVLGTLMAAADHLRIDHVMGLHRMYWVPRGMGAGEGAYVRYPAEELHAVLSLESHRHETVVAGEDLGTVPPEVREAMAATGLRRSYVVPFEIHSGEGEGLAPVPPGAVASLGTHDLPPFAAFWKELDADGRAALSRAAGVEAEGEPDAGAVLVGLLDRLGRSPAGLVMVSLEDLWLEERPQNRPGTLDPGNWRGRSRLTLTEMREHGGVLRALGTLRDARLAEPDPLSGAQQANKEP